MQGEEQHKQQTEARPAVLNYIKSVAWSWKRLVRLGIGLSVANFGIVVLCLAIVIKLQTQQAMLLFLYVRLGLALPAILVGYLFQDVLHINPPLWMALLIYAGNGLIYGFGIAFLVHVLQHHGIRLMAAAQRWLFNALSGLSLLLCLITAVMWVRSYLVGERLSWESAQSGWMMEATSGWGMLAVSSRFEYPITTPGFHYLKHDRFLLLGSDTEKYFLLGQSHTTMKWLGVRWRPNGQDILLGIWNGQWDLYLPYWMLTLILALMPTAWFLRHRFQITRAKPGLCPTCGNDLRASKDRCLQCGTPTATPLPKQP